MSRYWPWEMFNEAFQHVESATRGRNSDNASRRFGNE